MLMLRALLIVALALLSSACLAFGAVRYVTRGITADGRVIVWSRPDMGPPWARDIVVHPLPSFPPSVREKRAVGTTFVRVLLDVSTGKVRDVVLKESSGHPDIDASVITTLKKWRLRPNRWREFEIHFTLGPTEKLPPYKAG
jgi:TonB family protein